MAAAQKGRRPAPNARFHNGSPGVFPLDPPQREKNMSQKKQQQSKSRHSTPKAKSGGQKKGGGRRHHNPARRLAGGILEGLRLKSLVSAGVGALFVQVVSNAVPLGAPGSFLHIGEQIGLALVVNKMCPGFLDREAATAGAAAAPVVAIVNKVLPNLQTTLTSLIPRLPGQAAAAAGASGLIVVPEQYAGYVPDQSGMNGIVTYDQGSPLWQYQ